MENNSKNTTFESSVSSNQKIQDPPQIPFVDFKIYKTFIIIFSFLLLLLFGLTGFLIKQNQQLKKQIENYVQPATPSASSEIKPTITLATDITDSWKTYTSEEYGFSFKYPQEYFIQDGNYGDGKINPDFFLIRKNDTPEKMPIYVSLFKDFKGLIIDSSNLSFRDFAIDRALVSVSADSHGRSIYSDGVIEEKKYINENGIDGYIFHLNLITEVFGENPSKTNSTKGPIYTLDLSRQTNARGIMFIFRDSVQEPSTSIDEQNLEKMVSTFKF